MAEADESDGSFRHLHPDGRGDHQHRPRAPGSLRHRGGAARGVRRLRQQGAVLRPGGDLRRRPARPPALAPDLVKRHVTYGLRGGRLPGRDPGGHAPGDPLRASACAARRAARRTSACPACTTPRTRWRRWRVADFFGISFDDYREAMAGLDGRRPPLHACAARPAGVLVVDDYGHHPTEIAATVAAARLYGRRLVVAFQPHRYSRTRDLLADFAPALAGADVVVLTDIYAAGEAPLPGRRPSSAWRDTFPERAPARAAPRARRLVAPLAGPAPPGRPAAHAGRGRHHPGRGGSAGQAARLRARRVPQRRVGFRGRRDGTLAEHPFPGKICGGTQGGRSWPVPLVLHSRRRLQRRPTSRPFVTASAASREARRRRAAANRRVSFQRRAPSWRWPRGWGCWGGC